MLERVMFRRSLTLNLPRNLLPNLNLHPTPNLSPGSMPLTYGLPNVYMCTLHV